jgi:hypothetical protein
VGRIREEDRGSGEDKGRRQNGEKVVDGKGRAKKRPSVETEGRLTIACHMKNLQKIDAVCGALLYSLTIRVATKIRTKERTC